MNQLHRPAGYFVTLFSISTLIMLLFAQTAKAQFTSTAQSRIEGFYSAILAEGVVWTSRDLDIESERGVGLGARFGYYFENSFGLSLGFDVSRVVPRNNVTYNFAIIDFGASRIWGNASNRFRPYVRPAFVVLFGSSVEPTDDIFSDPELNNLRGTGVGAGVGSFYFLDPRISLQLSYNYSLIWINNLRLGLDELLVYEDNIKSHRLMFGVNFHF